MATRCPNLLPRNRLPGWAQIKTPSNDATWTAGNMRPAWPNQTGRSTVMHNEKLPIGPILLLITLIIVVATVASLTTLILTLP